MTTYCDNFLILRHKNESKLDDVIVAFVKKAMLSYVVPEPTYNNADARFKWRQLNWGTKRDIDEARRMYRPQDESVELSFITRWGPPLPVYDRMACEHGFKVIAYYHDWYFQVCGEYVPNEEHWEIEYQDRGDVPKDLDMVFGISESLSACLAEVGNEKPESTTWSGRREWEFTHGLPGAIRQIPPNATIFREKGIRKRYSGYDFIPEVTKDLKIDMKLRK